MKRIVWSISLLILLLNTLWTPLTYAEEYAQESVNAGIIDDIQDDDVVENDEGDEQSPQFPVNENFDDENIETIDEGGLETEEATANTWDVIEEWSWHTEEIFSWEENKFTWEVLELTGDFVEEFTWNMEGLTWEMNESTWTWEVEEIEYRKYNSESIIWEKTYNDVTVKVEALSWIFPEWTELVIEPIKWWNLSNLKDQLIEEKEEIKKDTTVVAFDITFIYSWEEVQPRDWEKVKVTFDYSNNEDLVKADNNDEQEVKVYHVENKDEEWNELEKWEEKIVDVTNVKESEVEWVVVADWESFSIYALVTIEGNVSSVASKTIEYTCNNWSCTTTTHYRTPSKDGYMFMWWYDQTLTNRRKDWIAADGMPVYAKWQKFWDLDVYVLKNESNSGHITMMDRNMWATEIYNKWETTDAVNLESMWYYYQWWNNYGFDSYLENSGGIAQTTNVRVDVDNYSWQSPYYGFKFYTNWNASANWMNNINAKKNLWWDTTNSLEARQWPCPQWYHVPTKNDWKWVLDTWWIVESRGSKYFYFDFLIPPAWIRDRWYKAGLASYVVDEERYRYASSSWNWNEFNAKAVIVFTQVSIDKLPIVSEKASWGDTTHERSANGLSVRCFKNALNQSSEALNKIYMWWWENAIIAIASWKISSLQNPTRSSGTFSWWYTKEDYSWNKIWVWSWIEKWSNLYAKWDCWAWKVDNWSTCVQWFEILFNASRNWWITSAEPIIFTNSESDPIVFSDYTAVKTWYDFVWWNTNPDADTWFQTPQTYTESTILYAIFSTGITATFYANGNKLNNETNNVLTWCTIYNNETGCTITTPTISNDVTTTVVGYTTSSGWSSIADILSNAPITIEWWEEYYAQTMKEYDEIIVTFNVNGNAWENSSGTCTPEPKYNWDSGEIWWTCSVVCPSITAHSNTPTVIWWWTATDSHSANVCEVGWTTPLLNANTTYYAQTKKQEVFLTWAVNGNNSTLSSIADISCTLSEVYNWGIQDADCEVNMPIVTPHSNTPTFIWWNTSSNSTANNASYSISSNKLTLTETNKWNVWYAITTAPEVQLSVSYTIWTWVQAIWEILSWCNVEATYNWMAQGSTCNVIAPTITVKEWYDNSNKRWEKSWSEEVVSEWGLIILTKGVASPSYKASANVLSYTIEYIDWLHATNPNPIEYTVESWDITLIDLEKEWFEFSWWYLDSEYVDKVIWVAISHWTTWEKTFYAKWTANKYVVTYNAEAHSWTINNQPISWESVEYGTVITLPTSWIKSQKWYTFQWWTTTLGWTESISNTYTVTGNVTFYPIFKKEKVQKDIKFYVNNNSWYIYDNVTYRENKLFSGCTIPTLYNTDPYTWSCSVHITLPNIIAHENTPIVLWWSTWANERTIKYSTWVGVTIIIPENKNVELYAQTKSDVKTYEATYEIDRRVEATLPWTPVSCTIQETFNGVQQKTSCEDDLITLPAIVAKTGYHSPVWKLWETEYASWAEIALSWNVIFTGTATPDEHTPYVVKHYYQTIANTNVYQLSWTDTLSWATETILDLSTLQVSPNSIPWFLYSGARVNNGNETEINITTITSEEWAWNAEIQPGLVIQLFYTRKSNTVTLNTIDNATVEKIPSKDKYYYWETIIFSGYANSWYTFSWWDIREWDADTWRREGDNIEYTMISTGVVVTPVIREHKYTIHFNGSWAVWEIDDIYTGYSENISLPTSGDIEDKLIYTGHDFEWWTTENDRTTIITEISKATDIDDWAITLYAKWKAKIYTVSYDYQAHSWVNENVVTDESYWTEITLPTTWITSQKEYDFIWWTTALNWKEPISNTYTVTGDITFYPIFKKDWEQKDITFHRNWNSWYRYENHEYAEDKAFSGCTIPTLYNTDLYTWLCSVHITLPDIIAHENTPTVLWWSTWAEERTISYATWVGVTITIPRGKEVELYAQTRSVEKEYTATYEADSRVEGIEKPSDTCSVPVTYNGNPQQTVCTEAITLPDITAKNGYNTPVWKLWETEYNAWAQVYLSWNVIFTGTATPDAQTPYTVKHYYQVWNTDFYDFSWYDTLSWATETLLELSKLQKNPLENTWFTYYKARVNDNDESDDPIDIRNIDDFVEEAEIQPWLVIQLFYTRNNNTLTLNTIEHAIVEKSPTGDSYYYGEAITFSGHAEEWYTFSWWSIKEWSNAPQTVLWTQINYTMPSTGVVVSPVIREHSYTIHFDGNWAVWNIADQSTLYSETVILPIAEQVAEQLTNTWHHFVWWTTWVTETTVLTELSKATSVDNGEVTLYAKWDVNDWTQYLVKYYLEPVEEWEPQSEYVLQDIFTWAAPTNSVITWVLKNYDWFTTPLELTWIVAADGSLVINYYYPRNSYTYTFNAWEWAEFEDWTNSTGLSFRYEQSVNEPELSVVKTWFTKIWWTPDLLVTMPHENKTSTVVWSENHYTIEYDANWWVWETPMQSNIGYTDHISLTWNQFTRVWYYFAWWSITKDWEVIYWDTAAVSGLTWVNNAIVKLYAHWEASWYTVTFDANSWDVSETWKNVIYDGPYWTLPEAYRIWYTFNWWYTDKVSWVEITGNTKVTRAEDHTLYAHWIANKYIVTFNANGWVVSQSTGEVVFDEEYWVLPTPTRIWYTFVWWYTEEPDSVKVTKNTKVTRAEDHILYAHWTANKYIVTFNANEWVVSQSTGEVTYNQSYWVLPIPTREWYSFSWWYTQAEGWEFITWTTTVTRTENHTLYAQWKANTYTVTFDANSWDVSEASRQVTFDDEYWVLPVATRTWYTFQWWYTEKDGWDNITWTTKVRTASNHTLYAHWLENLYTIKFNANGGVWGMSSMTDIKYTDEVKLTKNTFTRNGYQFNWWSMESDWAIVYDDEQEVTKLTGENNAIVTLYAIWQKWSYHISYELNGWVLSWGKTNPVGYDVDTETFTLNNPERDGYAFLWWSWTEIDWLSTEVTIAKWSIWDREYEANWKATKYRITYNLSWWELPSGKTNPETYTIESWNFTFVNPTREWYDFLWWSWTDLTGLTKSVIIFQWSTWDREYEANWKVKIYTITWKNSTWDVLETDENVEYWTMPSYDSTEPTSWWNVQYTYVFSWWTPATWMVVWDQVYTATYETIVNKYDITFVDEDWTELKAAKEYEYDTPAESIEKPADPTKAADAQYTYSFAWWNPEVHNVTWAQVYTATYTSTINKYEITFVNEDWTKLQESEVAYWDIPVYEWTIPTKSKTAQYTYTFAWWNPEIYQVTWAQVYTATYERTVNKYPVTFYDEDWVTVLKESVLYPYWTVSWDVVKPSDPTKASDGTYNYTFKWWTPEIETVVWTANYTATYESSYIDYQVIFLDSTWAVLTSGYYHSWDNVVIPTWPAKASTAQTWYTFKSWYPEVQVVTWDITYEPTYTETTRSYTIKWLSSTWLELREESLPYWSIPDYGENPTSWSTAEYDYVFKSWEPAIQAVTGDATYKATYIVHKRSYTITWNDEDWTELGTTTVEYWEMPVQPTIPTKDPTEQTWYLFNWWTPSLVAVTWPKTYTATYQEYLMRYTILWRDWDWEVIKTWEHIPYWTLIVNNKPSTNPSRESTAQTGYTFNDWYDENGVQLINSKKLTWDTEYTARYDEETKSYTIIWKDRNGTELEKDENVLYWTNPVYDGEEPSSWATAQYTYTFNWWLPWVHSVTWPEVYTASYKNTLRSYPITFYDEDWITVVKPSTMYPYGTPSTTYKPLTNPTKKWYSFEKWIPELEAVVWTADYKASYKINSYKVTPVKWVGIADIIWWWTYEYNTVVTLTWYAKAWYHFEWWETVKEFNVTVPANSISVKITAEPNTYYVRYNPGDWTWVMLDQEFLYDQEKELSVNTYTKEWLYFKEWTDWVWHQYNDKAKVKNLATTWVIDLFAIWTDTPEPVPPTPTPIPSSWGAAAWWGRIIPIADEVEHESADLQTWSIVVTWDDTQGETWYRTRTEEEMDAYKYAYKYHITTLAPREAAMPDDYVQRWHMAKMVVNYSINVLHRKLPEKIPNHCKWNNTVDSFESQEIKEYAEKACALWLMWIDMNYFQPNKYVTRAQFWTIFGRLLWWKLPSTPYYAAHLAWLKERWIMTQIENPEDRIEIRKWAWLMFMRSEKYFIIKK